MTDPKPRFTGIFIPVEILSHPDLSILEQLLLSWIDALFDEEHGGCFASNAYLAEKLKVKENTVAKARTHLRKLRLIEDVEFDGRRQVVRATIGKFQEKRQSKKKKKIPESKGQSNAALDSNPKQGWIKIQGSIGQKSNPCTGDYIQESKEESKEQQPREDGPPPKDSVVVPSFFSGIGGDGEVYEKLVRLFTEEKIEAAVGLMIDQGEEPSNLFGWLRGAIQEGWSKTPSSEERTEGNRRKLKDCFGGLDGKERWGVRVTVGPDYIEFLSGGESPPKVFKTDIPNFEASVRAYITKLQGLYKGR